MLRIELTRERAPFSALQIAERRTGGDIVVRSAETSPQRWACRDSNPASFKNQPVQPFQNASTAFIRRLFSVVT
jgi:hypothetical protein